MVDVVSDPDVLVLAAPHLPLPLTEVDVQVMQSDWRMRPTSPSASPPGSSLGLPDEVKSADDGDQAEHDHQEGHDADPDDGVGRGVERDEVRGGAAPLRLSWTGPGPGLIISEMTGTSDDATLDTDITYLLLMLNSMTLSQHGYMNLHVSGDT